MSLRLASAVCIVAQSFTDKPDEYLVVQRPQNGLLAGQWEFPMVDVDADATYDQRKTAADALLLTLGYQLGEDGVEKRREVGPLIHLFSHIRQTYLIELLQLKGDQKSSISGSSIRWLPETAMATSSVSTGHRKALALALLPEKMRRTSKRRRTEDTGERDTDPVTTLSRWVKRKAR